MADGEVRIEITADDSDIEKKLDKVEDKAEDAADSLEDLGDSAKKSGKGFDVADVAVGNFIANGVSALIGKVGEAVESLISLADETREYREDMAKLTSAFKTAGHSTEAAQKAYDGFYKLLGESDRSVEAVNHLAELTTNTEELAQWQTIAAGVTAKFGDSLPIEGLTEAANETAKVGAVTGPLADALNWAGISEDAFNEKLAACNSEQERASLITSTLSTEYQAAATEYNTLTATTQAAREATNQMEQAQAKLGATIEPMTTWWTNAKTSMLSWSAEALDIVINGTDVLSESQRALVTELDAINEGYRASKEAAAELALQQMADVEYAEDTLIPQLMALVDSNGDIKQGYEDRANFIMGQLNEAFGTEYTRISEIIGANGELTESIKEVIRNKEFQILIEQAETGYREAIEKKTAAIEGQTKAYAEIVAQTAVVEQAEKDLAEATEGTGNAFLDSLAMSDESYGQYLLNLGIKVEDEKAALAELQTKYDDTEGTIQGYYEDIAAWETAQTLHMEGKTDEAIQLLNDLNASYGKSGSEIQKTTEDQKKAAEDRVVYVGDQLLKLKESYETNEGDMTEVQKKAMEARIAAMEQEVIDAGLEAEKLGSALVTGIGKGADNQATWLNTKLATIVKNGIAAAEAAADVNSPSKVTRDKIGKPLTEGIAVGAESEQKALNKAMEGVIDKGIKAGKDYAGIHSPATLSKDEIGIWLVPGIAKGVEETGNVLVEALEGTLSGAFDYMNQWLKNEKDSQIKTIADYNKDIEDEEQAHTEALAQIGRDRTKELTAIDEKYADDKAKLDNKLAEDKAKSNADIAKLDADYKEDMAKLETDHNDNIGKIELKAYNDTEKQFVTHGNNMRKIRENINKTISDKMSTLVNLEAKYKEDVKKIWADLDKSINDLQKNYEDQLKSRTESIAGSLNLWDAAEKNKVSGSQLQKNLKSQVNILKNFNTAISKLEERGVNEDFVQSLKEMGVDSTGEIEALARMTDDELADYVKLWEEKNALAKDAAIEELEPLKEETVRQIRDLSDKAVVEYHKLRSTYTAEATALISDLKQSMIDAGEGGYEELIGMLDEYTFAGTSILDGVIDGIVERSPLLEEAVAEAVRRAIEKGEAIAGISVPVGSEDDFSLKDYMANLGSQITTTVNGENSKIANGTGTSRSTVDSEIASAIGQNSASIGSLASAFKGTSSGTVATVPLIIDGREFGRAVVEFGAAEADRTGTSLSFA